jgi:hypothetical protein
MLPGGGLFSGQPGYRWRDAGTGVKMTGVPLVTSLFSWRG